MEEVPIQSKSQDIKEEIGLSSPDVTLSTIESLIALVSSNKSDLKESGNLDLSRKSLKSAASKMDAGFKALLRALRNQITRLFDEF